MKKIVLSLVLMAAVLVSCNEKKTTDTTEPKENTEEIPNPDPAHNAQNSLDWFGEYTGTLPCADCEGIEYLVKLTEDNTFEVTTTYQPSGDSFVEKGNMVWHENGMIIRLSTGNYDQQFKVVENAIIYLDQQGDEIKGDMADLYRLEKK